MKKFLLLVLILIPIAFSLEPSLNIDWKLIDEFVYPNSESFVVLTLFNPSQAILKSVEIFAYSEEKIILENQYIKIGDIQANSQIKTSIKFKVSSNAKSSISYISLKISYSNSEKKEIEIKIPIIIKRYAILNLENINFSNSLEPGKEVILSFDLTNNGIGNAKNVVIKIPQSNILISKESEYFIKEISPNQKVKIKFNITLNSNLKSGNYILPIFISYFSEDEKSIFNITKEIGLEIFSKPNLMVYLESQKISENSISIKIVNAGNEMVKFLYLKFYSNEFEILPSEYYVGNLDSDDFSIVNLKIIPKEKLIEKEYEIKVEAKYYDIKNNELSSNYAIKIKYFEEKVGFEFEPIIFLAFLIFIVLIVFILLKKKRKW